jgi:hypothetical protein
MYPRPHELKGMPVAGAVLVEADAGRWMLNLKGCQDGNWIEHLSRTSFGELSERVEAE